MILSDSLINCIPMRLSCSYSIGERNHILIDYPRWLDATPPSQSRKGIEFGRLVSMSEMC